MRLPDLGVAIAAESSREPTTLVATTDNGASLRVRATAMAAIMAMIDGSCRKKERSRNVEERKEGRKEGRNEGRKKGRKEEGKLEGKKARQLGGTVAQTTIPSRMTEMFEHN